MSELDYLADREPWVPEPTDEPYPGWVDDPVDEEDVLGA